MKLWSLPTAMDWASARALCSLLVSLSILMCSFPRILCEYRLVFGVGYSCCFEIKCRGNLGDFKLACHYFVRNLTAVSLGVEFGSLRACNYVLGAGTGRAFQNTPSILPCRLDCSIPAADSSGKLSLPQP